MSVKFLLLLMCMDLMQFKEQIMVMNKKVDFYYVDIMDGNYVCNIILFFFFIENLKKIIIVFIDVYLMVNYLEDIIFMCFEVGVDIISFYFEMVNNKIFCLLNQIKDVGKKCGVVLNLVILVESIVEYVYLLDKVMVMLVDSGYVG